jgi:tetratricopeptide (TPR) repeat protein
MSLGELDEAVVYLRESIDKGERGSPLTLWGLYMSLGDYDAARQLLDTTDLGVMGETARLTMDGRYQDAFDFLEQRRRESAGIHDFDVAVARLALIAGDPRHAVELLEKRLPSLAAGVEPINIRTVLPALDLAAARLRTGERASGEALLAQVFEFFHGPPKPQSPQSLFLRARAHALSNQPELALDALEQAYEKGFRLLWAPDLAAWPFGYVDSIEVDPAFNALRSNRRYGDWLSRTKKDNLRQLVKLRERERREPRHADTS